MKMKKSDWIALIIGLVLIVGIAIGVYLSGDDKLERFDGKADELKESKLSAISRRIQEMQDVINQQKKTLNLTKEKERALNRKVDNLCLLFGSTVMACLLAIVWLLTYNGVELVNAISSVCLFVGVAFTSISIVCWKNLEFSKVMEKSREWAKQWLDRKYGHDPAEIAQLTKSIAQKNEQLEVLTKSIAHE